tara:strand:- start:742 stop:1011 length:270 start_codon:yes stop_codon:yes gene_type:complete
MAIFSIEIADQDVGRVIEALCQNYGYLENIQDPQDLAKTITNPEIPSAFANRMVRRFLTEHVTKYEVDKATKAAIDSINSNPEINDPQL